LSGSLSFLSQYLYNNHAYIAGTIISFEAEKNFRRSHRAIRSCKGGGLSHSIQGDRCARA